jgi:hypothetical protein
MLFLIFNFAACGPVWLCVGMFSCYHLYLASGNSTTIEGWEKDKVATLVRRGKIHDVKYPYVRHITRYRYWQKLIRSVERWVRSKPQISPRPESAALALAARNERGRIGIPREPGCRW